MAEVSLPCACDISATSTDKDWNDRQGSGILNGMVKRRNDTLVVTKRPGILTSNALGITGDVILMHGGFGGNVLTVSHDSSNIYIYVGASLSITIAYSGDAWAYIASGNNTALLVIPEPNLAYVWNGSTVALVTDSDFPSTLGAGVAYLDGFFYVHDGDAIYQSALNDPSSWPTGGETITPERSGDPIRIIVSYLDHVVAFNGTTIEIFYNADNPEGSVLRVREDLLFNIGISYNTVTSVSVLGDTLIFCGRVVNDSSTFINPSPVKTFLIKNFSVKEVSTDTIEVLLEASPLLGVSTSLFRNQMYFLTVAFRSSPATYVYNMDYNLWYQWKLGDESHFPLSSVSNNAITFYNLANLDYYSTVSTSSSYADRTGSGPFTLHDYEFGIKSTNTNFDTSKAKRINSITVNGLEVSGETCSLSLSKDYYSTYSTTRDIDTSNWQPLFNFGLVRQLSCKLSYIGEESLEVEDFNIDVDVLNKYIRHG